MRDMTDSTLPADFYHGKVPPRVCGQAPGGDLDELPRHPRPAGADLEMIEIYAVDYGVPRDEDGRMQRMNMRPFLDAVAAKHDHCFPCLEHHIGLIAADPALTTHVVGVGLLNFGIHDAPALQLLRRLDPDGGAIALVIRNRGLLAAVELTRSKTFDQRQTVVKIALNNAIAANQWFDMPVSNLCPPGVVRPTAHLGDDEWISNLKSDGHL